MLTTLSRLHVSTCEKEKRQHKSLHQRVIEMLPDMGELEPIKIRWLSLRLVILSGN